MHTLLRLVVTCGLVILQTTEGLTAPVESDAEFLDEAAAEGFIVHSKEPPKPEKPHDNYHGIVIDDSLNPKENISQLHKDSLPTGATAKTSGVNTELNTHELPKYDSAAVPISVGSGQTSRSSAEENAEGSGIFPERRIDVHSSLILTTIQTVTEMDISNEGSGMLSETHGNKQDENVLFTTTAHNYEDLDTSTLAFLSSEENVESEIWSNFHTVTTSTTVIVEDEIVPQKNNKVAAEIPTNPKKKESRMAVEHGPQPTRAALVKESTHGWLLILGLCLTIAALVFVFVAIGTKDIWYGPIQKCLGISSTESKKHEEYDKATAQTLSEKEWEVLRISQSWSTGNDVISLEEAPEKEYLM